MLELAKICKSSHEIAKAAGWTENPPSTDEVINLFISENSEALEDYRNNRGNTEVYYEVKFTDGSTDWCSDPKRYAETDTVKAKDVKPCGIPIELADVVIRICQYCGTNGLAETLVMEYERVADPDPEDYKTLSRTLFSSTREMVLSLVNYDRAFLNVVRLAKALILIEEFCTQEGINLTAAVDEKSNYNRTRAFRHGGKRI